MSSRSKVAPVLPAFLLAAYPICVVLGANPGVIIADLAVIGRDVTIVWAGVALLLVALRPVIRDFGARTAWLNWLLLTLMLYVPAVTIGQSRGIPVDVFSPGFATLFTLTALAVATAMSRPWQAKRRDPWPMNIAAGTIVLLSLYPWLRVANPLNTSQWRKPVDAIIQSSTGARTRPRPQRDIYYIVLDGMGSPGTLRTAYDVDAAPLVDFLRSKGFHVPDEAHSNYGQTYLSLASTLNMTYLEGLAKAVGSGNVDRRPLHHLIQHNALMRMAHDAGYRVSAIGSDYQATEGVSDVDACLCPRYGLDEIEVAAMSLTPLAAVPVDKWTFDAHRRKVLESFSAIERVSQAPGPDFVFAHIIAPHPPFLFGPDGSPRRPRWTKAFSFSDGNHFLGSHTEYQAGYRDQTRFVLQRLKDVIDGVLARGGPEPIVIVHGDHGPGRELQWESAEQTNIAERFGIFAAYKFPGAVAEPEVRSPINGTRTLAREYFGAKLPPLPDQSFYSRWSRPYDFVPVNVSRNTKDLENSAPEAARPVAALGSRAETGSGSLTSIP
jgi:hypothetical protein